MPRLEKTAFYDLANFVYQSNVYCCKVELEPETGKVCVDEKTAAEDFGKVMNPMLVTGKVHGGLGQGIGQALVEQTVYNDHTLLLSASYMDYDVKHDVGLSFLYG